MTHLSNRWFTSQKWESRVAHIRSRRIYERANSHVWISHHRRTFTVTHTHAMRTRRRRHGHRNKHKSNEGVHTHIIHAHTRTVRRRKPRVSMRDTPFETPFGEDTQGLFCVEHIESFFCKSAQCGHITKQMSHVAHMNESRTWRRHGTRVNGLRNESGHARERVMAHAWMRRLITYEWDGVYVCMIYESKSVCIRCLTFLSSISHLFPISTLLTFSDACTHIPYTCYCFVPCAATHCNKLNTLQHTATHCNTLQHAATRCNTLQCAATHWNALQRTATHCDALRRTAMHYNALQHTATHCDALQRTAAHCRNMPRGTRLHLLVSQQYVAVCCSVLQCVAVCCSALQGVAGRCRVLQGVAGCCRVLQGATFCPMHSDCNTA